MKAAWPLLLSTCVSLPTLAQAPPSQPQSQSAPQTVAPKQPSSELQKKIEDYLRNLYAWGPDFHLKIGPLKDSPVPGLYEFTMEVTAGEQSDTGVFYVSKDGRFLVRGDIQDMSRDPLAEVRAQLNLTGAPSKGPSNAKITIVEFADFECPSCRELHNILREIEPHYPQVRVVFKDFPLANIHPWAITAASAAHCAYEQDPAAFWKMYDRIYDGQEYISPANAWDKMLDFAGQLGLDAAAERTCMADPATTQYLDRAVKEAQQLRIANTPTVFVNGRRLIGPVRATLEQFINYELSTRPSHAPSQPPPPPRQ
jgi:protein-disulfide isomerase